MAILKEELLKIKAFVFDVDGVLSRETSPLGEDGEPVRTSNVKDGFAIRNALRHGLEIAVITGGVVGRVKLRHQKLGIKYYYDDINNKIGSLQDFLDKTGIDPNHVLYMGDDLVDYLVMKMVGLPVCPNDAASDVKKISKYVSDKKGGEGCVRDVIEQVLRAQGKWMDSESFFNRSF